MNETTIRHDNVTAFPMRRGCSSATTIVVPCYNEEKRLDVETFKSFLASGDVSFVFVNDGSRDRTMHRLEEVRSADPSRVTILDLRRNSGKAEAVRQGLLTAIAKGVGRVGYWDADLATPLDAIGDFVRIMDKFPEVQVVYGARRMLLGHRIERTMKRRIVSRICATLARQAVRLPIGDTQCGAKLFRNTPLLEAALNSPFTAGWLFDVELFSRLSASMTERRHAFYEQPLAEWSEIAGSKVSTRAIVASGVRMLRLIAEVRTGRVTSAMSQPSVVPSGYAEEVLGKAA